MKLFTKLDFKIEKPANDPFYEEFHIEPLERGFGTTLGNALRRTLISSTPGASVFAVQIKGALHEFSPMPGVVENVSLIILNIKELVLKINSDMFSDNDYVELKLSSSKTGDILASDIACPTGVEIINKDLKICTLNSGKIEIVLFAKNGRGYRTFKDNKKESNVATNTIPVDSNFSPIENVSYEVEGTKIGNLMDYERLILKVHTNGSITPSEAVSIASKIICDHLATFVKLNAETENIETVGNVEEDNRSKDLDKSIEEVELTLRSLNCLKRARINTLRDLVTRTEEEIEQIRNLGNKSLKEIKDKVESLGLTFRQGS